MPDTPHDPTAATRQPELSLIMPCYNEEEAIPYTIPQLVEAFGERGHVLEIVACDNGSTDGTSEVLERMIADGLPIVRHRVEQNEGYGNGILSSMPKCTAPWIGFIPADGQVDAEDVVRLWEVIKHAKPPVIGKVRRRFRMDGVIRKVVSISYNGFVRLLWPTLQSVDVNGVPKIIHRDTLQTMQLESKDFFLDPELMIKAHYLDVPVLEMNVFARMRSAGRSHIRAGTCWEFVVNILGFKFGGLARWRRDIRK